MLSATRAAVALSAAARAGHFGRGGRTLSSPPPSPAQAAASLIGGYFQNNSTYTAAAGPAVVVRRGYAKAPNKHKGSARQTKAQAAAMDISE